MKHGYCIAHLYFVRQKSFPRNVRKYPLGNKKNKKNVEIKRWVRWRVKKYKNRKRAAIELKTQNGVITSMMLHDAIVYTYIRGLQIV